MNFFLVYTGISSIEIIRIISNKKKCLNQHLSSEFEIQRLKMKKDENLDEKEIKFMNNHEQRDGRLNGQHDLD